MESFFLVICDTDNSSVDYHENLLENSISNYCKFLGENKNILVRILGGQNQSYEKGINDLYELLKNTNNKSLYLRQIYYSDDFKKHNYINSLSINKLFQLLREFLFSYKNEKDNLMFP